MAGRVSSPDQSWALSRAHPRGAPLSHTPGHSSIGPRPVLSILGIQPSRITAEKSRCWTAGRPSGHSLEPSRRRDQALGSLPQGQTRDLPRKPGNRSLQINPTCRHRRSSFRTPLPSNMSRSSAWNILSSCLRRVTTSILTMKTAVGRTPKSGWLAIEPGLRATATPSLS